MTGKKRTRSATYIQVPSESDLVTELSAQEAVEDAIFAEVNGSWYTLAKGAPICRGKLFEDFGYLVDMVASKAVLNGTYPTPPDLDAATKELFDEVTAIRQSIPSDSVSPVITPAQWRQYWAIANEETSLSESGPHFGYYIVGNMSNVIAHYHAARVTVVLAHAMQLKRWSRGMSFMLEKMLGVTLVTKLWSILLMEVDFDATNKIMYGVRMMGQACKHHMMPDEIYSVKNRMADDGTLTKILCFNIARQSRTLTAFALVDASNCYSRIAHAIASLVFQSFGVPKSAIGLMLKAIEEMKFFLQTDFGNSKRFAGGGASVKVQGLTQGNGVSPAGWAVISVMILCAHGKKGHSATILCPITNLSATLSAILYVDDTDLLHINLDGNETAGDPHAAIKHSMKSWGDLLMPLVVPSNQRNVSF